MEYYSSEIKTNVENKEIAKESLHCIGLLMMSVDSVLKKDDKYYSQMFLKLFKYIIKKKEAYTC